LFSFVTLLLLFCCSFVTLLLLFCYSFVVFCYSFVTLLLLFCYSFVAQACWAKPCTTGTSSTWSSLCCFTNDCWRPVLPAAAAAVAAAVAGKCVLSVFSVCSVWSLLQGGVVDCRCSHGCVTTLFCVQCIRRCDPNRAFIAVFNRWYNNPVLPSVATHSPLCGIQSMFTPRYRSICAIYPHDIVQSVPFTHTISFNLCLPRGLVQSVPFTHTISFNLCLPRGIVQSVPFTHTISFNLCLPRGIVQSVPFTHTISFNLCHSPGLFLATVSPPYNSPNPPAPRHTHPPAHGR
jgi:hypothetical protein